jgi:hypothetical protein
LKQTSVVYVTVLKKRTARPELFGSVADV